MSGAATRIRRPAAARVPMPAPRDLLVPAALGAACTAELVGGGPWPASTAGLVALTLLMVVPLAWMRAAPLAALVGCVIGVEAWTAVAGDGDGPMTLLLTLMLGAYAAGSHPDRRRAVYGAYVIVAGSALIPVISGLSPDNTLFALVLGFVPWVGGRLNRRRRDHAEKLHRLADELERARDEHERMAVVAERARIAGELNDAVAHGVTDVLMQANAAAEILERDPEAAAAALRAVQERGRATLAELRRMLFVMRADSQKYPT
jgi:signal transduction histidine kinase